MGLFTQTVQAMTNYRALQEGPLPITAARVVEWMSGPETATGIHMSPEGALRVTAAYACIRIIAEDVASLPLHLYRRVDAGKERATNLPLYRILHDQPNPHMTAMQFRETLQAHLLMRGNAYAEIERDATGAILALWPLRPDHMDKPVRSQSGQLLYTYHTPGGEPVALRQVDVLPLRGLSSDGITGYSPVTMHRETLALSEAQRAYGARFFGNNSQPGGVLETDKKMTAETIERLRKSWESLHQGLSNAHRVAILEDGVKWQQIGLSNGDAQFLESRKLSRTEIASIWRVPPHMIGDLERATYSNVEEMGIAYVKDTLQSWLVRWEQQLNMALLTEGEQRTLFAEHLIDAQLRGKTLERYEAYERAWWMTPNEKRGRENMNIMTGLDEILVPSNNLTPLSLLVEMVQAQIAAASRTPAAVR